MTCTEIEDPARSALHESPRQQGFVVVGRLRERQLLEQGDEVWVRLDPVGTDQRVDTMTVPSRPG